MEYKKNEMCIICEQDGTVKEFKGQYVCLDCIKEAKSFVIEEESKEIL